MVKKQLILIKVKPDIVFLDIVMPVKDGNTAIKEIIAFDKDATIFIASSVGSQTQLKSAIESGAKDFIQKPLDTQQVVNLIEKYIGENNNVYTVFRKLSALKGVYHKEQLFLAMKKNPISMSNLVLLPFIQVL